MAVSFVNATSVAQSNTGSVTINVPSGVADGDVLVMAIHAYSSTAATDPAGWTLIASHTSPRSSKLWWRLASAEPASYTITTKAFEYGGVTMAAYRGAAAAGPTYDSRVSVNSSGSQSLVFASWSAPASALEVLVAAATDATYTNPSGWTQGINSNPCYVGHLVSGGAAVTLSINMASANEATCYRMALPEAASGQPTSLRHGATGQRLFGPRIGAGGW